MVIVLKAQLIKQGWWFPADGLFHLLVFKDLTKPWNIQSALLQCMQLSMQLQTVIELFKSIDNT